MDTVDRDRRRYIVSSLCEAQIGGTHFGELRRGRAAEPAVTEDRPAWS